MRRPKHKDDGASAITHCTPKEIHMKGHLKGYTFDQIFDEKTSQLKVYKTVVGKMISDVSKGYNCTIFAYGQTGTGKTYTVIGNNTDKDVDDTYNWQQETSAGIIVRAAMHLYDELDKLDPSIQRTVTVSFMEIYNEEIRDLLCDRELTPLRIYEDKVKGVHVKNLQEVTVLNPCEIISLLRKGCEKRQVASTLMNNRSSRSHTVFTISISTMQTMATTDIVSKLHLIDLAGSENIAKSGSKDLRAREATNINQSLLTLGRVIKALVENSSHVPYRESKLTRILQDSLGGKAKTSIIATISPGVASLDETMNTLDYACNARNITNCPTINLRTSATAAAVQKELQRLKRDLFATSANEQGVYMDKENYDEITQCSTQFKKEIANKNEAIRALTDQVEDLEAQRHEWKNLKESFRKTCQACEAFQLELQRKEKEMLRDTELLQCYKSEFSRLEEFADLLSTRENHLHNKLNHVYASSSQNQNVVENIVEMVEKTISDLFLPTETNNFSVNINSLLLFNMNVCQKLTNVTKKLEIKSHKISPNGEAEEIAGDDYSRTILGDVYESIQYLRNKFRIFTDTCNSKILEIHDSITTDTDNITKIQEALLEGKEKETKRKALLSKDSANYIKFKENLNEIEGKQKSSILEYFEERQKSIEREQQRIKEIIEMLKTEQIRKEITDYEEKRRRIFERISNLDQLEDNVYQKIKNINEKALECIGGSRSSIEEIRNCVSYIRNETSKVSKHVLNGYREQNSEMANVLKTISHIHDIEGKTHIEMVNESLSTTGKELKESVKRIYETSFIRVTRTGDTPKPFEKTHIVPRGVNHSSNSSSEDPTGMP